MRDIEATTFNANIGSPRSDDLIGILLIIYFENSLGKLNEELGKYLQYHQLLLATKIHQMNYNKLMMQILLQKMKKKTTH